MLRRPIVTTEPPTSERPQRPPSAATSRGEWRTALEPFRLLALAPTLAGAPRGDGRVVIDVPGFKAPELAMAPLRAFLRAKGHDGRSWGLGTNQGDPEAMRHRLVERAESLADSSGRSVSLVAWSLGGVIAREAARLRPELFHRVVVYGSPLIGGPTYTLGARSIGRAECARIAALQEELDQEQPVTVPITSIFTRRDGVVAWQACMDHYSLNRRHVEVRSTHLGLGIDPDVWLAVAEALAA